MSSIKNLIAVSERIKKAVKNGERIIIYGDSDMDGIASTVILEEAIKSLGGSVFLTMFPDRETDGYGVNQNAIRVLRGKSPALFITLDLGISNALEVDQLNELGFSVIVIDHHQPPDRLPQAELVIDPKQPGDASEATHLANVGITFLLCQELLGRDFSGQLKKSFLELTALATISDMVPQIKENKMFIEEGLRSLKDTFRPALRAFLDLLGEGEVFSGGLWRVLSALNAAESKNFENESYQLLVSPDAAACRDLANDLLSRSAYKQMKIKEIVEEVERRIARKKDEPIIFEGDPSWRLVLAGSAASVLYSKHNKPTFIFKKGESESYGSVRSPQGKNSVEAMKSCQDLLITYGGHPQASGFRLKNENVEEFKKCLRTFFEKIESRK
jgi:single-stranded-DNA-specific exonuclease